MPALELSSVIAGDAAGFLGDFDLQAVNRELGPLIGMSAPPAFREQPIMHWRTGERLFASWVLLFGLLPLDRHHFRLAAVIPGSGFRERSSSWINREWHHDRSVETVDGGIRITDRVAYTSRIPGLDTLLLPLYRAIFAHRHRRLRRHRGEPAIR